MLMFSGAIGSRRLPGPVRNPRYQISQRLGAA